MQHLDDCYTEEECNCENIIEDQRVSWEESLIESYR